LFLSIFSLLKAEVFLISEYHLSTRSTALSHSDIAFTPGINSVYSNPAGIVLLNRQAGSLTYHKGFGDTYLTNFSGVYQIDERTGVGASVAYIGYGDFENIEGRSFSAYDFMGTFTGSRVLLNNLTGGVNLKVMHSKIDKYSSTAMGVDVTGLYRMFDGKVKIGAGFYNLGSQFDEFESTREDLPASFKVGASNKLDKIPIEIGAQYNHSFYGDSWYSVGAEFRAKKQLVLRAGYDFLGTDKEIGTNSKVEKFAGASLGASLTVKGIVFDVAYVVNGELDPDFSMSVTMDL